MRVLIPGADRAIGAATATEPSRRGHHVVATARVVSLLDDLDVAQRLALEVTGGAGRSGPELVAIAIAVAVEDPSTPMRLPVRPDAEVILATRGQLGDAPFEAAMRQALDLTW